MFRSRLYDYFFFALLIAVLTCVARMLAPFSGAILASLVCAVIFYPIYTAFERKFPRRSDTFVAILAVGVVLILVVTPLVLLIWAVIQESSNLGPVMKQWTLTLEQWRSGDVLNTTPWMRHMRGFLGAVLGMRPSQFQVHVIARVSQFLETISFLGAHAAEHAIYFIFDLLVMHFTLFFLFRDGMRFYRYLYDLIPIKSADKERLFLRAHETVIGVTRGWLLTSFVQGVLAAIGYLAVGIDGAVLLGVLTGVIGLLPVVGTFGIWVPVGIFLIANGSFGKGAFVLIWGAVVIVGLIDTLVRPYLVGKRAELPIFALFFALLGGVEVWGAKGIILGPILVAMAPVLLEMYRERYLRAAERPAGQLPMGVKGKSVVI